MMLRETFAEFGMDALLQWVMDRNPPLLFEQSLRLQPETVESRRCLFSLPTAALGATADSEVLQICRAMSSPEHCLHAIHRFFRGAHHVHFGFEYSDGTLIGKCYLELAASKPPDPNPNHSKLRFLGYKWSMNDPTVAVVSRYRTLAASQWTQLTDTMQQQVPPVFHAALSELLDNFQPTSNVMLTDLALLEVEEEGSDRKSYDLNVYAHERQVADIANSIRSVAAGLNIDASQLDSWITAQNHATVGHVAIGQSRTGLPFVTIYHSADVSTVLDR